MKKEIKLLNPKLDVVFQALFGEQGSERITKAFLETILEVRIEEIELNQNAILRRENMKDKLGVLDVLAKINNNENVDIEMQISRKENIKDRILYYWSRLYVRSIKKSEDYEELEKSIAILITDEKITGLEELECHTEWKIIETKNRTEILTDKLELHIIELEKISNNMNSMSKELLEWLLFLENPESERVINSMKGNKELKEAKKKLEKISEDDEMQQLAWWREKAVYEENERKREIKKIEEGRAELEKGEAELKEGRAELEKGEAELKEGRAELEKGEAELKEGRAELEKDKEEIKEGREQLKKGREKLEKDREQLKIEKNQMIKKLLENKVPINIIIETTGLTKEEIERLQ